MSKSHRISAILFRPPVSPEITLSSVIILKHPEGLLNAQATDDDRTDQLGCLM